MQRRLVPAVTILLGSASGGVFASPNRTKSKDNAEAEDASSDQEPPGTVVEPVYDPRPPLCKLGPEEE
jgi:hypothetical protein